MNGNHLSNRLQMVAQYVPHNSRMADIGSDHAYLPVYLAKARLIEFSIACEVAMGPHYNASQEIQKSGTDDIVSSRLANGLLAIKSSDNIDTIVIAGMGGALINNILTMGINVLTHYERLILQPNVCGDKVRRWLQSHNYKITIEKILEEDGHIYEIIVGDPVTRPIKYSELELIFGPFLMREKTSTFVKKWKHEAERIINIIEIISMVKPVPEKRIIVLEQQVSHILEVIK